MKLKSLLNNLFKKGFFHIFSADIFNKFMVFGISIIIVNFFSKSLYGEWAYAMNIISFFLLFSGLGVNNGVLYYGTLAVDQKEKHAIFRFGLLFGIIFNSITALAIFGSTYVLSYPIEGSIIILRYLSLLPIFYIMVSVIQAYFRANFKNKEFSFATSLNSILLFTFIVVGSFLYNFKGVVYAYYLAYFMTICFVFLMYIKKEDNCDEIHHLTFTFKKEFLKYSATCSLTNGVSSLLYIIDIFLIGLIIKDETILASYKVATFIPFALNFIPLSIMTFAAPYFIKMSKKYAELKINYLKMKKYLFVINLIISSILFVMAPFIIQILFGEEYLDSVIPFRILSVGYFIAGTFRIPNGNVIASIGKVKFNLIVAIICSSLNIILDVVLISTHGAVGAAIATVSIFILSSILTEIYLIKTVGIKLKDYIELGMK